MAEEFCAVTGASESEAAEYLERCNGDGKLAMERFFEESKAIEQRRIREGDLGDTDEAAQALAAVGVTVTAGASLQTMREALKAHYKGKDMTPRQVFDSLDEDSSGFLDRAEVEKASGVLGAGLGFIMSAEELDKQFTAMDPDGDGEVTFEEFQVWWKGVEAEQLVGDMDEGDVVEALQEAGIDTHGAASIAAMRAALKTHYSGKAMTVRQVFDALDDDDSGYLDRAEVEKAAGILGGALGELMSEGDVQKCFDSMDPDGDGQVTFEEFEVWWKWQEAEHRVGKMDAGAMAQELRDRGIELSGTSSTASMREALKALYSGREMTVRELFDELDEDDSGFLDRGEVEKAAGLLGGSLGVLLDTEQQEKAFREMDPDGTPPP